MKELQFLEVSVCAKNVQRAQYKKYKKNMQYQTKHSAPTHRGSHLAVQIHMFQYICIDKVCCYHVTTV